MTATVHRSFGMSTEVVYLERCFRLLRGWFRVKLCFLSALYAYNYAPVYSFVQSHILRIRVCSDVTCHPHFWHNDRDLLRATTVTGGWNRYCIKSQHGKLTMERKIRTLGLPTRRPALYQRAIFAHCSVRRCRELEPEKASIQKDTVSGPF